MNLSKKELKYKINYLADQRIKVKDEFTWYISNKEIPLEERWEFFLNAPEWLKNTTTYIYHFKCLEKYTTGKYGNENFYEDEIYQCVDKHETPTVGCILESIDDNKEIEESKFSDQDIIDLKEEFLENNIGAITFDW
jgi:hypothetical protein